LFLTMKNKNNFLPLHRKEIKSIAVIGPNGNVARVDGGGSGEYYGYYQISPLQGILNKVGNDITVQFERGIPEKRLNSLRCLMSSELSAGLIDFIKSVGGDLLNF